MAWDEASIRGPGALKMETKAQECQMQIGFHSPRGIRRDINAGWEGLEGHLHSN